MRSIARPAAPAISAATSTIPIVVPAVVDPVDTGLVARLARPGGNLTGLTFFVFEIYAKRVELIREAIPTLMRAAVLINPANPAQLMAVPVMQRTASALGVELVLLEIKARDDIAPQIATATRRAQAPVAIEEPLTISNDKQIAELALQNRLPVIGFKPQAEAGALIEYGVDLTDGFYRSAAFVDKILKGTSPADLPVERAVKFELIVNLKTARMLGIELPTSLLIRANEVIE